MKPISLYYTFSLTESLEKKTDSQYHAIIITESLTDILCLHAINKHAIFIETRTEKRYECKGLHFFQRTKVSHAGVGFWSQKVAHLDITGVQAMGLNFLGAEDQNPSEFRSAIDN
ncbi:hypothetical protein ACFL9U_01045 [Thermodesulfobacteriota bacterium]